MRPRITPLDASAALTSSDPRQLPLLAVPEARFQRLRQHWGLSAL